MSHQSIGRESWGVTPRDSRKPASASRVRGVRANFSVARWIATASARRRSAGGHRPGRGPGAATPHGRGVFSAPAVGGAPPGRALYARRVAAGAIALLVEALEGRGVVVEDRDDDLAVTRGVLRLDDDVVAVVDVVLDHRLPAHTEHERVMPRRELGGEGHRLGPVLVGLDR